VAIQTTSSISNNVITKSRLAEIITFENSETFISLSIYLLISFFILRIAETEKLSFLFYVRVAFLLFVNFCMFFDNLRLIFTNGSIAETLSASLWPKSGHFAEGLSDYISMLAYVYEMADCYLASRNWLV